MEEHERKDRDGMIKKDRREMKRETENIFDVCIAHVYMYESSSFLSLKELLG